MPTFYTDGSPAPACSRRRRVTGTRRRG
jgi:hypothetical protein